MTHTSGESTADYGGEATISALHPDILETHILTRLDGPALASAAVTCAQFHALSSQENHWSRACQTTWPSTKTPRVRHVISTLPNGSRSFFADSFTTASRPSVTASSNVSPKNPDRTPELISAVDIFHRNDVVLSKVVETETETGWFRCSPFRVDLLDPKDAVRTRVNYTAGDDTCRELSDELRLSWIVIDPVARRAVNVSSGRAVSVRRHWLTGDVEARFATVVSGERGTAMEVALCSVVVTWGGVEGGEMHVREVSFQMEDMDGTHLNGRDSLVILQRALEGKRGRMKNDEEALEGYREFEKRKNERKERKMKIEGRLDMLCVGLAALSFVGLFGLFVFWR